MAHYFQISAPPSESLGCLTFRFLCRSMQIRESLLRHDPQLSASVVVGDIVVMTSFAHALWLSGQEGKVLPPTVAHRSAEALLLQQGAGVPTVLRMRDHVAGSGLTPETTGFAARAPRRPFVDKTVLRLCIEVGKQRRDLGKLGFVKRLLRLTAHWLRRTAKLWRPSICCGTWRWISVGVFSRSHP